jgi:hypothetical protein
MPLYGGERDVSLFRHLNKELIDRIIRCEVGIYVLSLNDTAEDLYGEADNKVYYEPVKVSCLVNRSPQDYSGTEEGIDYKVPATFAFLLDSLKEKNIVPKPGDIIHWDNEYYECDALIENQYFVGKSPEVQFVVKKHGWNVSHVISAHVTKRSRINLADVRSGINKPYDLPRNL